MAGFNTICTVRGIRISLRRRSHVSSNGNLSTTRPSEQQKRCTRINQRDYRLLENINVPPTPPRRYAAILYQTKTSRSSGAILWRYYVEGVSDLASAAEAAASALVAVGSLSAAFSLLFFLLFFALPAPADPAGRGTSASTFAIRSFTLRGQQRKQREGEGSRHGSEISSMAAFSHGLHA